MRSRHRLPAEVTGAAGLGRGERVLAAEQTADGTWLLGTRLALVVVPVGEQRPAQRVPWDAVERAGWDAETQVLTVSEVGEWGQERPVHRFGLERPGRLLELLRERVSSTVLLRRRVDVDGDRGVSVQGRRSPSDGAVQWRVEYDEGLDPTDPVVSGSVDRAVAAARAELGE